VNNTGTKKVSIMK